MRVAVGRGSGERVRKCKRQRETEKRREQSRRCKAPFLVYYLKQIPKQMNSLNENSLLFLYSIISSFSLLWSGQKAAWQAVP